METFYCSSCDIFSSSHRSGRTCGAHRFTMTRTPPSLGTPTVGAGFSLKRSGSQPCVSRALSVRAQSLQLCPTLYNPIEWSPPGSPVHGILQARILEGDCPAVLLGIFPTQGPNPRLLHHSHIRYRWASGEASLLWSSACGRCILLLHVVWPFLLLYWIKSQISDFQLVKKKAKTHASGFLLQE